jgi:hypothetical protein
MKYCTGAYFKHPGPGIICHMFGCDPSNTFFVVDDQLVGVAIVPHVAYSYEVLQNLPRTSAGAFFFRLVRIFNLLYCRVCRNSAGAFFFEGTFENVPSYESHHRGVTGHPSLFPILSTQLRTAKAHQVHGEEPPGDIRAEWTRTLCLLCVGICHLYRVLVFGYSG